MSDADPGQGAGSGNQSGNNGHDWVTDLGLEDDKAKEVIGKFNGPKELAKSYVELERKLGRSVQLPGEDATEEQRMELFKKLGMPDSFEGYDLSRPQDLPEGLAYDEDFENAFKAAAHKSGLTKTQARGLYNWYNTRVVEQVKQAGDRSKQSLAKTTEAFQKEWGDNYEKETTLTRRAVEKYGGQELQQYLDQSGLGNDPRLIRAFNKIAHAVGEDSLVGGEEPGATPDRVPGVLNYPSMKGLKPGND
jgi:hypothetical protein